MTKLDQFVSDAIKTESKIDTVKVNSDLLLNTLHILIDAGNILDQIKKHVFYNKPYKIDDLMYRAQQINGSINALNNVNINELIDNENEISINPRIFHAIVGIATESTELLETLDLSGKELDNVNICEEFGDLDWYKAIGCDELNISWDTILDTVIAKLKARYPDNFTSEDAINRDLDKEREILDTMETEIVTK